MVLGVYLMVTKHFIDGKCHINSPQITIICATVHYLYLRKLQVKKNMNIMHLCFWSVLGEMIFNPVSHACGDIGICQWRLMNQVVNRHLETGKDVYAGDAATLLFYKKEEVLK